MINLPYKLIVALAGLAIGTSLSAQIAPPAVSPADATTPAPSNPKAAEELVILSPFVVNAATDTGYAASSTLGGTRLNAELKDVASQIDIMTEDFLNDIGALNLNEAIKYSLNGESATEYTGANDQDQNVNVFSANNGTRTRGLTRSNTTHDFFETNFPLDTYNTGKRITFVSGSNAILFGAGLAGGTNDVAYERPDLRRVKGNLTYRTDNNGSHRGSINVSVPLINDILGVRFASLKAAERDYRSGIGSDSERNFATIMIQPHKRVSVRAWIEKNDIRHRTGVNTVTADYVTRWIESGKPAFNNLGVLSTSPAAVFNAAYGANASATNYSPLNNSASGSSLATGNTYRDNVRVLSAYNPNGALAADVFPQLWTYNTVNSLSHNTAFYGQDPVTLGSLSNEVRSERAILDPSIYPTDDSVIGNAQQQRLSGNIKGVLFEYNPIRNVYVEGGYNREDFDIEAFSFITGNDADLKVDINRYLPNNTPGTATQALNPNFGKFYVEDDLNGSFWNNRREDKRLQVAFSHDPASDGSWLRWLGNHRGAVMYSESKNRRAQNNNNLARIVSSNVIPGITGEAAASLLDPTQVLAPVRIPRIRYYLDPQNGSSSVQLPFDPWENNTFVMGKDANGSDIVVNTGISNPYGVFNNIVNGAKTEEAFQFALNSSFFSNRVITTVGKRFSDATFSSWVGASSLPRYNPVNGQFEVPVGGIFPSTGTALPTYAGYASAKVLIDQDQYLGPPRDYTTSSELKSVVVHPFKWLSFHYNHSSSNFVAEYTSTNVDGGLPNLDDGATEEYGFSIRLFDNKLVFKANHYVSESIGAFGLGNGVAIPSTGNFLQSNDFRWSVVHLEKTALNTLGAAGIPTTGNPYSAFMTAIRDWTSNTNASGAFGDYGQFHDRVAKGNEFTITANPTSSWTLRGSLAINETRLSNIASEWYEYINYRLPVWREVAANNPNLPMHIPQTLPANNYQAYFGLAARTWQVVNQSQGQVGTQEAKYRARFTTAYDFKEGKLKGFRVGAGARYDSPRTIAYRQLPLGTDNPFFNYPEGGFTMPDLNSPLQGKATITTDAFIGYKRRINKNLKWSVNLNIRNVLNDRTLIPQDGAIRADGSFFTTRYAMREPRTFSLTNIFEF